MSNIQIFLLFFTVFRLILRWDLHQCGEVRCQYIRRLQSSHTISHRPFRQRVMFWGSFTGSGPGPLIRVKVLWRVKTICRLYLITCCHIFKNNVPLLKGIFSRTMRLVINLSLREIFSMSLNHDNRLAPYSPDLYQIENLWGIIIKE